MSKQAVTILAAQMDEAWEALYRALSGLSDDEFFWEPVPDCWTTHKNEHGRWIVDYELPEPKPSPFTTIGWRLVHIAACKIMYHEYAFGAGALTWDELIYPHTAAGAITWLEEGQALLNRDLAALKDDDLPAPRLTNWGEQWPTWRIFWTMIHHDVQHGAEIGCLRDLYRIEVAA
ncbi:MAG: hypothetical protein GTO14_23625 [Anaerolineales bacterium]|nr:hypothetical protein [Anaerolineales bacterium]